MKINSTSSSASGFDVGLFLSVGMPVLSATLVGRGFLGLSFFCFVVFATVVVVVDVVLVKLVVVDFFVAYGFESESSRVGVSVLYSFVGGLYGVGGVNFVGAN